MKLLFINILSEAPSASFAEDREFVSEYVNTAHAASEKMHLYEYDCILLYCSLQNTATREVLAEIGKLALNSGLIILSADISVEYRIQALNSGADDCLTIPYHSEELGARIRAVIRRKKFNARDQIHFANTVIDLGSKHVFVWNTLIPLTRKEYDIFIYLVMNHDKTVSHTRISDYLWGEDADNK
ncbi:MAG: response regulator transcription factor, partial [Cytophagales bacterium]|nr:response regulator transcription factor [Cytophaga sp.]